MSLAAAFERLSPTTIADALTRDRVMDIGIRPLCLCDTWEANHRARIEEILRKKGGAG